MASIELKNISKKFEKVTILENINFTFREGLTYLIKGKSGEGKTTLLNILAGYIKPDSGSIIFDKSPKIAYFFQDEMLFSNLTVSENLFIKYCTLEKGIEDFEIIMEQILVRVGILSLKDRKIAMLSGGERQRVQLASILFSDPDILLFDEPTSKLDDKNKEAIVATIVDVFKGKTLIIVSHDNNHFGNNCVKLRLDNGVLDYEAV